MNHRLLTLDAMRGLAALVVIVFHANIFVDLVPNAYLAVDFFFILSGVVIARAYAPRLATGMTTLRFMKERVIRLWPLALLGLAIGTLWSLTQPFSIKFLAVSTLANIFFLPSPLSNYSLFPNNVPAWSLFLELIINFVFAISFVKMSSRLLSFVLALLGSCLIAIAFMPEALNVGDAWHNLLPGIVRALFSFGVGVLMARFIHTDRPVESWFSAIPMVLLVGVLITTDVSPGKYDLWLVMAVFPIAVWLGALCNPPAILTRLAHVLGDTSYAMYALHYPLMFIFSAIAIYLKVPTLVWLTVFCLINIPIAYLANVYFDAPVRAWLKNRSKRTNLSGALQT